MVYFFVDDLSLLFQIVINTLISHGVAPLDGANVEAAFLTMLIRQAGAAAQAATAGL